MKKQSKRRRRGLASLELVLATGIAVPFAAGLMFLGFQACKRLYHVIGTLVGWPYL
jgi:hypothetical protein